MRRTLAPTLGALTFLVLLTSLAWACTTITSPYLDNLEPREGQTGTTVTVRGGNWNAGSLQLEWRDGSNRKLSNLRTVSIAGDGTFATTITVPSGASAAMYHVGAVQGSDSVATPFEVTTTGSSPGGSPPAEESTNSTDAGDDGSPGSGGSGDTTTTTDSGSGDGSGSTDGSTSTTIDGGTSDGSAQEPTTRQQPGAQPRPRGDDGAAPAPAPADGAAPATQPADDAPTATSGDTTAEPVTPAGPAAGVAGIAPADDTATGTRTSGTISPLTLREQLGDRPEPAGDAGADASAPSTPPAPAWSGLPDAQATPGLPELSSGAGADDPLSALAGGIVTLAVGVTLMLLGFGIAELRRRHAPAAGRPRDEDERASG